MAGADWKPRAGQALLRQRATLLRTIREYFHGRGVLEVETPALSAAATTEPALHSFSTRYHGPGAPADGRLYLHTSPEFPMKRLLAAGSGSIYQLCKVFRDDEAGRLHNPEFSLLEYYLVGVDHHGLMDDVEALLNTLLGEQPARRLDYRTAFIETTSIDPLYTTVDEIQERLADEGIEQVIGLGDEIDPWLELAFDQLVAPALGPGRVFVHAWPASQAALACINADDPRFADRFEVYIDGIELANGFYELTDAASQRQRFELENRRRVATGLPAMPVDERLLAALEHGLPDCAGVAIGIDRLLMLYAGCEDVASTLAFPIDCA